ncbi:hypothetical protein QE152_g37012 [Popillia japonica]|uniref:Uncharacterized protein n=1 Tax=Popillia japonica TaxID=7064 RepID=A0AAW1IBP2_POPJA
MRRKRANTNSMWLRNVSAKVNDGPEKESELEIVDGRYFIIHYVGPGIPLYIATIDCVLLEDDQIDLISIMFRGHDVVQLRFGSANTKMEFVEAAFHSRQEDSGNSSLSPSPSPPEN